MVPNIWRISLASCQGAKQSREAAELCFFDHLNRVYTQCTPHTCDQAASAFQKGWCNLRAMFRSFKILISGVYFTSVEHVGLTDYISDAHWLHKAGGYQAGQCGSVGSG